MEKNIRLHINGMYCVNCQNKIEKQLNCTCGIIHANVSYKKSIADIKYDEEKIKPKEIIAIIEALDYKALQKPPKADMSNIMCMLIIIISLYIILQKIGLLNLLVPEQLADHKMGYSMLFVIGLLTSVHCLAMCGGINLSQCLAFKKQDKEKHFLTSFYPVLTYNLGRILSYTVIGFLLGMISFLLKNHIEIGISYFVQGMVKIIAGLLMIVMGINMLDFFPWLNHLVFHLPKFFVKKIRKEKNKRKQPFIVGFLNGFMPCGPLQSMWIVALSTSHPLSGALSMFMFGLGTVPLMLGFGTIVVALGRKFSERVMTIGAVFIIVFGLAMLSQGGSLSGWFTNDLLLNFIVAFSIVGVLLSIPVETKILKNMIKIASILIIVTSYGLYDFQRKINQYAIDDSKSEIVNGVQIVNSSLSSGQYPNITVQSNIPVKWIIHAPKGSINGCNYKFMIQDYNIEYKFHTGENIIEFTPNENGTIQYSCWMGMIHGQIFVNK